MIVLRILRFIFNKLFFIGFTLTLVATIALFVSVNTVLDRETVKTWPADAGVYDQLVDVVFEAIETGVDEELNSEDEDSEGQTIAEALTESALDVDGLIASVEGVFDAEFIRTQYEGFIDAVFNWLDGDTEFPQFVINLSSKSDQFINDFTAELRTQLNSIPECTPQQLQGEFEVFSAVCLPPGLNLNSEIDSVVDSIANGEGDEEGILQTNITWETFVEEDSDDPENVIGTLSEAELIAEANEIKEYVDYVRLAQVLIFLAVIIFAGLAILTTKRKRSGVMAVGGVAFWIGLMTLISAFSLNYGTIAVESLREDSEEAPSEAVEQLVRSLADAVGDDLSQQMTVIGLVVAGLGATLVGLSLVHRRKGSDHKKSHKHETRNELPEAEEASKGQSEKKPKPAQYQKPAAAEPAKKS